MTKLELQNIINTKIRTNPSLILKTDHADSEDAIIDSNYPNVVSVTHSDTSIITLNPALAGEITYNANIYKQGRTVTIHMKLFKSTTALESDYIFQVTNSEYLGEVVPTSLFIGFSYPENGTLRSNNRFYIDVLTGGIKEFTLIYQTIN